MARCCAWPILMRLFNVLQEVRSYLLWKLKVYAHKIAAQQMRAALAVRSIEPLCMHVCVPLFETAVSLAFMLIVLHVVARNTGPMHP